MNKFQLMGRLTRDPEQRSTANNLLVTTFSLAVNRKYVAPGQERQADFFNVVAYGKMAEFCSKYYKKGQQVLVEGRMQNRTWEDQNGQKRYSTDYIVENGYFADSRRDGDSGNMMSNNVQGSSADGEFITIDDNEDLPF
ncbi:MAG: single-stranded DNA-binding protein [Clostridia bacterium]